jgi:hypothetical protein
VNEDVKLNELDKTEWRDVLRRAAPHVTDEEFDAYWVNYHQRKDAGLIEGQHTLQ